MAVKPAISRIYGLTLILLISSVTAMASKKKLRFVSVVFRHGNRAPDGTKFELYPKDPHVNDTFYPVGPGGLTNTGKQKMYKLGKKLRKKYNDFLGNMYIPGDVEARSSDVPRTKTSLQLVLAGLYRPKGIQRWNKNLNWQPIATKYVPKDVDKLFFAPYSCSKYAKELRQVIHSPEVEKIVEKFHPILNELTIKTGRPITDVQSMLNLYHGLTAEKSMQLKLPKWTKKFFPDGPLLEAANLVPQICSWNNLLKRLSGGVFLKRIIDDMKAVVVNDTSSEARKINLFSGHWYNVAAILNALGLFVPHMPQYSSAVIVELIRHKKIHYVKIIRYLGKPSKFIVKKIPNCLALCPLDTFIKLMKPVTPLDVEKECKAA